MFGKIYQLFNPKQRITLQGFPMDLIHKVDLCIKDPNLYNKFFLNITKIAYNNFVEISKRRDGNFLATSFIKGYEDSGRVVSELVNLHLKVGTCGIYNEDLYLITAIDNNSNNVTIKRMTWGKDEIEFEVDEIIVSQNAFIYSNSDMDMNLVLISDIPID